MKDLRLILSIFLLILVVLLLSGCGGVVPPSPGATEEDVTTISGQIKMPLTCCDTLSEQASSISRDTTCDESEIWPVTPGAIVELKSAQKGQCKKVIETTTADDTGNYIFEDVKPGLYIITAYCPVEADEGFLLKDVAEKLSGEALDAGIPDCTSTAIALVIEKINNCYNDWYQCYGRLTASKIYKTVETIASDIGKVDIPAIKAHADFGNYCDDDIYGLVDMICEWSCCIGAGATGGGGGGPTPNPCADNNPPYDIDLDNKSAVVGQLYNGTVTAEDDDDDTLTFAFTDGYTPPGDMAIDSVTGVITWTPTVADICFCEQTSLVLRQRGIKSCDPIQVTVSDPCESVDEEFCVEVQPSYELTMQVSPVGSGTTDPAIGGPYLYTAGEVVDINAFELGDYQFLGWTSTAGTIGDPDNQDTTFTMPAQDVTVTAIFRLEEFFDGGNVTVGFEDLPSEPESDFDYNDFILDITTTLTKIIEGDEVQLKEIQFTFTPKARGAGKNSSFWFHIPKDIFELNVDNNATYELVISGSTHSSGSSGSYDPTNPWDEMVIPWAREALPGTHNHTNTWEFDYSESPPTTEILFVDSGVTAQLNIVFDQPISFDFSGYNPYSDMHGQGLFYRPYLKVYSGGSSPIPGSPEYIVNEPDMGIDKRIITVPVDDGWKWPEEGIFICDAYPNVGHSGGIPDDFPLGWWLNPAEDGEDGYGGIYGDGIPKPY